MDLEQVIRRRRSVRRFKPDPVPEADVARMLELACLAPSASNQQMWRFVAISNREVLERMRQAVQEQYERMAELMPDDERKAALRRARGYSSFFTNAPVVIAVLGEPYTSGLEPVFAELGLAEPALGEARGWPDIQSIGAAVEHLLLAAVDMGYGGCWMTGPVAARQRLHQILGVEPPWRLLCLVPIGVPAEEPRPPFPRREGSVAWVR